jgi:hypothetical protein
LITPPVAPALARALSYPRCSSSGAFPLRQQQAASFANFDFCWLCAVLSVALVVLVLFVNRSVAEKGEH